MYEDLFRERLFLLRSQKNASARDMSLSIGQNASYINGIENKVFLPSMTVFFYICDYLNVTPKEFFNDCDKYPIKVQEIMDMLLTMSEKQLDTIKAVAESITEG